MLHSIFAKLILIFILVSLAGIGVVTVFAMRIQHDKDSKQEIEDKFRADISHFVGCYYKIRGSLEGLHDTFPQRGESPPSCEDNEFPKPKPIDVIVIESNTVVAQFGGPPRIGTKVSAGQLEEAEPIPYQNRIIGHILTEERPIRLIQTLFPPAIVIVIIILGVGTILVRNITRPIRDLTLATQAIAAGNLDQQVPVRSKDELGKLATAFNRMSADLARANQLRRQMTADIAHDLRNPLAVLAGYVEGLRDGVLQPNPTMIEGMYDEVHHLQRLVADLRTLSLADAKELQLYREEVSPHDLLEKLAVIYEFQARKKNIDLAVEADARLPTIEVDPERMTQVFINLVSNALRYTPDGGQILIAAKQMAQNILFIIEDNGTGIAAEKLPHIFERFYRADEAREQNQGESGLGLAIVKSLVEAHGGNVSVESVVGQGTKFTIMLPPAG